MRNRFWWIEMIRGVLTFSFGILYLSFHTIIYFLIYVLGVYFLLDSCIDLFHIFKGRKTPLRHFSLYLGATASGSIGLLSLVDPHMVIVLTGLFFVLRVIIRGGQVFGEARRQQGSVVGLHWLYGIALILLGLVCLLPAVFPFIPTFLFLFLGIYALGDGMYMLGRALYLRLTATSLTKRAKKQQTPENALDLPAHFLPTTRRALVFLRRAGASGLGHVGWAFEWNNGWLNAGSVENYSNHALAPAGQTDFWTVHTTNPVETMAKRRNAYDEYKVFFITDPHPKAAWKVVIWASQQPYRVIHRNCVDTTYDILRAYGLVHLPDPATEYAPNDWYDSLEGQSYPVKESLVFPVHLHRFATHPLATREIELEIPKTAQGTLPSWRARGSGLRGFIEIAFIWQKMLHDVKSVLLLPGKWKWKKVSLSD